MNHAMLTNNNNNNNNNDLLQGQLGKQCRVL